MAKEYAPDGSNGEEDEEENEERGAEEQNYADGALGKGSSAGVQACDAWIGGIVIDVEQLVLVQVGNAVEVDFIDGYDGAVHAFGRVFEGDDLIGTSEGNAAAVGQQISDGDNLMDGGLGCMRLLRRGFGAWEDDEGRHYDEPR